MRRFVAARDMAGNYYTDILYDTVMKQYIAEVSWDGKLIVRRIYDNLEDAVALRREVLTHIMRGDYVEHLLTYRSRPWATREMAVQSLRSRKVLPIKGG